MKVVLISASCILIAMQVNGQTFSEWFFQNSTQLKYLRLQIAALVAYEDVAKAGYNIIKKGTSAIGDIKSRDMDMHSDYFKSLEEVNPLIKNYSKVAAIIKYQLSILDVYNKTYKDAKVSLVLNQDEKRLIHDLFSGLLKECGNDLLMLSSLTTDWEAEMKDDERLRRIDELYLSMRERYGFALRVNGEVDVFVRNRMNSSTENKLLKSLYGL